MEDNKKEIQKIIADYERSICRIVLVCLTELPFKLGMKKMISVLKGSKSTFNIDNELFNLKTFGVLGNFSVGQLKIIIDILKESDLMNIERITEFDLPVLTITDKGREYIYIEADAEIVVLDAIFDWEIPKLDSFEEKLFKNLKARRNKMAKEQNIPAYMICGDQILRHICIQKPKDRNELLSIRGIGKKFVEKYGEIILLTIN